MEGKREMKITASPMADIVLREETAETKASQKNLSCCVRKQGSGSQQGGSWGCFSRPGSGVGYHTPMGSCLAGRLQAQPCGKLLISPL